MTTDKLTAEADEIDCLKSILVDLEMAINCDVAYITDAIIKIEDRIDELKHD